MVQNRALNVNLFKWRIQWPIMLQNIKQTKQQQVTNDNELFVYSLLWPGTYKMCMV